MRCIPTIVALLAALVVAATGNANVTTTVIVEFEGEPAAVQMARAEQAGAPWTDDQIENYRADLAFEQDAILAAISAAGINHFVTSATVPDHTGLTAASIPHRYTMVFNGAAIDVSIDQIAALRAVDGVKRVHRGEILYPMLDNSVRFINANAVYGGDHALGPFDDLIDGYEGQGINLSVLDTGVEHHHEMFGGDPTLPRVALAPHSAAVATNEKIIYTMPTADPFFEDGFGHGTHVASTAAGYLGFTLDGRPVHGVAPQANIMSYGVCQNSLSTISVALGVVGIGNPLGGCRGETILLGLEDSVARRTVTGFAKPVAHVINMSLGSPNGSPNSTTSIAASNAALAGATVVAAAGNSGQVRGIVGAPSVGVHVISVAASTDPNLGVPVDPHVDVLQAGSIPQSTLGAVTPAGNLPSAAGEPQDMQALYLLGSPPIPNGSMAQNYVYVTSPVIHPAQVSGRIAIVDTGGAFVENANAAAAAGAVAAIIPFDNPGNGIGMTIPGVTMKEDDVAHLVSLLDSATNGAVSNHPIRLEAPQTPFQSNITGFSSRGPVAGFGQVKPDVAAPGESILAALPPASLLGGLDAAVGNSGNGPSYGDVSGTSMASPHVAGAAALVKQANPTWSPAMIRTALINTSTPMRDGNGVADSYGTHNPDLHSQGGGLVDVAGAVNAKALMGVRGDGVDAPSILGSHSFAGSPLIGSECSNASDAVTVDLMDTRGTGGVYNLRIENNRGLSDPNADAFLSTSQVAVPAGGSASFQVGMNIDGSAYSSAQEFQFYVVADRDDGSETLSMPVFFRAVASQPAGGGSSVIVTTEVRDGTIDAGANPVGINTFEYESVDVPAGTFRMVADLDGDIATSAGYPDYDLRLYDPDGNQVGSSGNFGSIEHIDVQISVPGTYTYEIENYAGAPGSYTLTVSKHAQDTSGASPATVDEVDIEFDADIDGAYTVTWTGTGEETAFFVEERANGGSWTQIAQYGAGANSHAVSGQANGTYDYRVISHFPGVLCTFVADPSNVVSVTVHHREPVTVSALSVASASGGSDLAYDIAFRNDSGVELYEPIVLTVTPSSGYSVENADVGSNGFDLDDEVDGNSWSDGEVTAPVHVDFDGPNNPFFTIEVEASAYRAVP